MARLTNNIILISGGARGQGAAEARLCVEEGARVIIGDVLESAGRQPAIGQRRSRQPKRLVDCTG
jgi:3alpha(or 20beta)-hydroxysteroid dehydrogenase